MLKNGKATRGGVIPRGIMPALLQTSENADGSELYKPRNKQGAVWDACEVVRWL